MSSCQNRNRVKIAYLNLLGEEKEENNFSGRKLTVLSVAFLGKKEQVQSKRLSIFTSRISLNPTLFVETTNNFLQP